MLSEQELEIAAKKLMELRGLPLGDPNRSPRLHLTEAKAEIVRSYQVMDAIRYARESTLTCNICHKLVEPMDADAHRETCSCES